MTNPGGLKMNLSLGCIGDLNADGPIGGQTPPVAAGGTVTPGSRPAVALMELEVVVQLSQLEPLLCPGRSLGLQASPLGKI